MSITRFSRKFVATCVEYKIARVSTLRDYDIVMDHKKGLTLGQLANKYKLSKQGVFDIIHKYE